MLEQYRVLDLTNECGLFCGRILADLGADVIAVEPPGGSSARQIGPYYRDERDPNGSLFWWAFSRNKRGITLDIQTDDGREQLRRLAETADFLIESFPPGYLDTLDLGYEVLAALNPRLVMVSITPFGQTGPKSGWAATDLTAWAASGTLLITGDEDRPPVRVPGEQAWLHAGAEAAVGALVAHFARERDGLGQHVDVSAQTAAMLATQLTTLNAAWGDRPVSRVAGGLKFGPILLRLIYPCRDGHVSITFFFGSSLGPFSRRLMEWLHEEGFVDAATRDKDWIGYADLLLSGEEPVSELLRCIDAIERFTQSHTKAELFEGAMRRGTLIAPLSTTADLLDAEQLAARDYWTAVPHPELGRTVTYPGPLAKLSATPIADRRRAPLIGEHTAEVLADLDGNGQPAMGNRELGAPLPIAGCPLPLDGVRVLDFTWAGVGPLSTLPLAQYGATVVRVESSVRVDVSRTLLPFKAGQAGPERSGLYASVNANKIGLTLNLTQPEARQVALRLAAWADVVAENYSPKAMRVWGLHYEAIRAVNPGVVMLSACLNGQTGPHAQLAGFGTMGAQIAGFGELVGWPDRPPSAPFGAYTDYISPRLIASALLAALDHRRRTGEGQYIDAAQVEAAIHFLGPAVLDYTVNGRVQTRTGNASAEHAPHGVYPVVGEDRWVAIACADEAQWAALCAATAHPEWQTDPRFATFAARQANAEALEATLAAWTAPRDVTEIEKTLQAARVPVHRLTNAFDAIADPQLLHRGAFVTVDHPELGSVSVESSRFRLSRTPSVITGPGPTFGQHNNHVLREILGMSDEEIGDLVSSGALE